MAMPSLRVVQRPVAGTDRWRVRAKPNRIDQQRVDGCGPVVLDGGAIQLVEQAPIIRTENRYLADRTVRSGEAFDRAGDLFGHPLRRGCVERVAECESSIRSANEVQQASMRGYDLVGLHVVVDVHEWIRRCGAEFRAPIDEVCEERTMLVAVGQRHAHEFGRGPARRVEFDGGSENRRPSESLECREPLPSGWVGH